MRLIWLFASCISASLLLNEPNLQPVGVSTCKQGNTNQQWEFQSKHNFITLKSNGFCLDVENYSTDDKATVWTYKCHPEDTNPKHLNEAWIMHTNGTIVEIMSGKCLVRKTSGIALAWLFTCTGSPNELWTYNAQDLTIHAKDSGLCLDGAMPPPPVVRVCDTEPAASMLFCDHTQPLEKRVENIIANLTEDEKIGLFTNGARSVSRLNFPAYQWWSEALHGVGHSPGVHFGGPVPAATSFPQVILTGAAFNQSLWHSIGTVISTEARAFNNVQRAGLTFWAPNINIQRDPRWGRGQETPGEDPFTTSEYAANFVSGMQGDPNDSYLKVSSCCKHYAAYDLENWGGVDRHHFNAIVTEQDMADTYLPGFQSCIERGHGSSLMCSYNAINGVPSCANADIMTTKARKQWGFQGYITSDCGAVNDVYKNHKYTKTPDATVKAVLSAGMDIDCGGFLNSHLKASIDDKSTPITDVDNALKNLFAVQFRLGMFDPFEIQPYLKINYTDSVNTPAHQRLALEAAQQGIVLLKNDGKLPLDASSLKSIAVIGPNGDATTTMQGNYQGTAPYLISPLEGINKYVSAAFTKGCSIKGTDKSGFDAAKKAASSADATVIIVGIDGGQEGEGRDRTIIHFPGVQNDLITEVSAVSKGPVIVISMAGGQVDLSTPKNSSDVNALLWCGYPGQSGGQAIADILFGTINPSGRLPYTIYPANYINGVSMFDMGMRPNASSGNPGRTYRFYTGNAVYGFGSGLSYTTFSYSSSVAKLQVSYELIEKYTQEDMSFISRPDDVVEDITITVQNTGKVAGSEVVMAYMKSPNAGEEGAPLQKLVGFKKVHLTPGQKTTVKFPVSVHDLTFVTEQGTRKSVMGEWQMFIGPESKIVISVHVENL